MAWQHTRFKSNQKLLAENEKSYETKERPKHWQSQKSAEESMVLGDVLGLFQKLKRLNA